jgi:hypothetical protein
VVNVTGLYGWYATNPAAAKRRIAALTVALEVPKRRANPVVVMGSSPHSVAAQIAFK